MNNNSYYYKNRKKILEEIKEKRPQKNKYNREYYKLNRELLLYSKKNKIGMKELRQKFEKPIIKENINEEKKEKKIKIPELVETPIELSFSFDK